MKTLFLTSSTITENLVNDFEALIGRSIKGLKVAFIPDAGYGMPKDIDTSWIAQERAELIDMYNWNITDFILKNCNSETLKSLFEYDVIYVNGGFSGYLAKVMRQSGFEQLFPSILENGIVYVGSSAGSMVMSDVQDASSWYLGESEPEALNIPGLGYIYFQIYPHVTEESKEEIMRNCNKGFTYYLMKDGSAVSIDCEKMKLCGDIQVYKS